MGEKTDRVNLAPGALNRDALDEKGEIRPGFAKALEKTMAEQSSAGEPIAEIKVSGDPTVPEAALIAMQAERDAALAQVETVTAERDAALAQVETVTAERDAALQEVEGAKTAIAAVEKDFVEVSGQRDKLRTEISELTVANADLTTKLATATKAASVSRGPKPPHARAAVAMEMVADRDALLAALETHPHQIVFSDGAKEILSLDPFAVTGKTVWNRTVIGLMLNVPLLIRPDRRVTLAGFALLDGKGKQIAWSPLMQPLAIDAGQEVKLDRQIIF